MKVLGTRVRELRNELGSTREQLAVDAGISVRTLARIENDEGPANLGTLRLVAYALDCEVADFTDEESVAA